MDRYQYMQSMKSRRALAFALGAASVLTLAVGGASAVATQTLQGTLMDVDTDQPIPLGLVMMYTESGDSVTATISTPTLRITRQTNGCEAQPGTRFPRQKPDFFRQSLAAATADYT